MIRELGRSPGSFPEYRLGVTLGWGFLLFNQPIAIMVLDPQGKVVDFACAVDANPFRIQKPKALSLVEWNGAPLAALTSEATTWQRVGSRDTDSPDDWRLAPRTIKQRNLQLGLPFSAKLPLITEPAVAGPFSNGLWTGSMRVSGSATEASLRAIGPSNNAAGDLGSITVEATKDLAALLLHRPFSTLVDEPLSLRFALTNTGPIEARAITWNIRFPPELKLQSAAGEGAKSSVAPDGWRFQWDLIPPSSAREIQLTFQPAEPGSYKLLNEIPQTPGDSAPENNFLQLRLDVGFPLVVVQNTTVLEGHSGTSQARFRVRLSGPIQRVVEVDYTTVDAGAVAGFDYQSTQGTLVFPPGVTQQFIEVPVIGDRIFEVFESFDVTLLRARNATIADGTASASIIEDELEPALHVGSVTFVEGQPKDAPVATVPIFLTGALGRIAAANWFTADGTALAGGDYVPQRGQVIFFEGQTQHVARIPLIGDRRHEGAEYFSVVLTNLFAVRAGVDRAQVKVLDDDAGELHSLGLIVPSEPQTAGRPFAVSVHAVDASGARRHDFEGRVQIRAFRSVRTNTVAPATNEWGFPLRSYFEDARGQYLYSTNELGSAGLLSSIEINLKSIPGQVLENLRLRCKPHAPSSLESTEWDNSGWTTLFEGDWQPPHAGWVNLPLSTPFPYDGTRPLLLDILFDNGIYSSDGIAFATDTGVLRSRVFATDSAFGPPAAWDGSYPRPELSTLLPAMRFSLEETVPISQPAEIILRGGEWTGEITIAEAGDSVRLAAVSTGGLMGSSAAIRVMPGLSQIQPTITAIRLDGSHVEIRFQGQPGITYQVEGTDTLSPSRWMPLGQPVVAGTSELTHREILSGEGNSRFYRVRVATDP
ncbi:MAG: hypothetical protein FJ405_06875 [Verrucomicrobia bacterium]|nr:hypothetical protein [Verrucomicrobiota bacterium]